jgi:nucleoside-diphosphate-sugar epimerase
MQEQGPLILGASGRLGRAFQHLWAQGQWPESVEPLWHYRSGPALSGQSVAWDLLTEAPPETDRIRAAHGVIVLAGITAGQDAELARNTDLARAAVDLARRYDLGPVLLCSSSAVYGRASGLLDETMNGPPVTRYGQAKLDMEQAVTGPDVTCLRLANVAGFDQLFGAAAGGRVLLDQFPDGQGPARSYIGPRGLAFIMLSLFRLARRGTKLPPILNVATGHPLHMNALLDAAGLGFDWRPAPPEALPRVALDTRQLGLLVPANALSATPASLVAEARLAGWAPA